MNRFIKIVMLILATTILLTGCIHNTAPIRWAHWHPQTIDPAKHDYTILGPVRVEKDWHGILGGAPIPIPMLSFYLVQWGGVNYVDVLEAALRRYPTADAVIDITYDYNFTSFAPFYTRRTDIVTGMAIRYEREQRNTNNRYHRD